MTIQEYLREFLAQIGPVSDEERQQISDYYQELICEGLERGMSEAEILAAFGSPAEAAARFREETAPGKQKRAGKRRMRQLPSRPKGGSPFSTFRHRRPPSRFSPPARGNCGSPLTRAPISTSSRASSRTGSGGLSTGCANALPACLPAFSGRNAPRPFRCSSRPGLRGG